MVARSITWCTAPCPSTHDRAGSSWKRRSCAISAARTMPASGRTTTERANTHVHPGSCHWTSSRACSIRRPPVGRVVWFTWSLGEPFLHPQAEDMIAYAKHKNPSMRIVSSTNGIALRSPDTPEAGATLVSRHMTFTIAGIDQPTYVRYHGRGSAGAALERHASSTRGEACARPCRRPSCSGGLPALSHWNDSAETIAKVKALAAEMGVDKL